MITVALLGIVVLAILFLLGFAAVRSVSAQGGPSALPSRLLATAARFPLPLAAAAAATLSGLVLIDLGNSPLRTFLLKVLAVSLLTLPLFIAARLRVEIRGRSGPRPDTLSLVILAAAMADFFLLGDFEAHDALLRQGLWTAAACLLLLLLPFTGRREAEENWCCNAVLVRAFLVGFAWALVLFAGISGAFAGMDYLLAIDISSEAYGRLWVLTAGFIGVAVFLANVPADLSSLRISLVDSQRFVAFARFVLLPLVLLYLIILYAYAARIIAAASWPEGGVAGFILGFCGVGIFAYLLIYPARLDPPGRLMRFFRRAFFPLVLPLAALLFLAVWRRVSEYGVTETRYFGIAAALWLGTIALYFSISRRKDFRLIPASLCLVALLASLGPWGAVSVSERSQLERLRGLLEETRILTGEHIQVQKEQPATAARVEISRIIAYLHRIDRLDTLIRWSEGKVAAHDSPEQIAGKIGVEFITSYEANRGSFRYYPGGGEVVDIEGFDYLWPFKLSDYPRTRRETTLGGEVELRLSYWTGLGRVTISDADGPIGQIDFAGFTEALTRDFAIRGSYIQIPGKRMRLVAERGRKRVLVVVSNIYGEFQDGKPVVKTVEGLLLLDER